MQMVTWSCKIAQLLVSTSASRRNTDILRGTSYKYIKDTVVISTSYFIPMLSRSKQPNDIPKPLQIHGLVPPPQSEHSSFGADAIAPMNNMPSQIRKPVICIIPYRLDQDNIVSWLVRTPLAGCTDHQAVCSCVDCLVPSSLLRD